MGAWEFEYVTWILYIYQTNLRKDKKEREREKCFVTFF